MCAVALGLGQRSTSDRWQSGTVVVVTSVPGAGAGGGRGPEAPDVGEWGQLRPILHLLPTRQT